MERKIQIIRSVFRILTILLLVLLFIRRCSTPGKETYRLLDGTELAVPVYVNQGTEDGFTIYLVAGIHGNEPAGWKAARQWRNRHLDAGTIYIAAPVNRWGAEQQKRRTQEDRDINRNFPGDADGWDAERIADAVYQDIAAVQPDLVLDLHEAETEEGRDALGDSLICESLDETGGLILSMLEKSGKEESRLPALTLYGSPPPGSINRVVTEILKIPVITVETDRREELEIRIQKQNSLIEYILTDYGILNGP